MRTGKLTLKRDTVHDGILEGGDVSTKRKRKKKNIHRSLSSRRSLQSSEDKSAESESGFESVIQPRKKNYYKKIKRRNKKKRELELKKRRMEIIVKFILYVFSNLINVLAVINYIIGTFYENSRDPSSKEIQYYLQLIDVSFSFYFLIEYFFLFTRLQMGIIRHIFCWDSLIDAITIIPSIVMNFVTIVNLNFLRVFRIFRVFRILRIYKSLKMIQLETSNDDEELEESGIHLRFDPIKMQFFTILLVLLGVFVIGAGLMLGLQDILDGAFSKTDMNFFDAMYFMIVTYCSVGYGDIIPTHFLSRFLIILVLLGVVIIVSEQLSKLAHLLIIWGPGWRTFNLTNHLVVICDTTFDIELFLRTIKMKDFDCEVIVIAKDNINFPSREFPYNKVYVLNANSHDFETFERASTKHAKAIFIICSKSVLQSNTNEKVTDFLILKLNRFYNEIPIYVQTLYSERSFKSDKKNFNPTNKNFKFKKIVPIMLLKSLMISKCTFNHGFAAFMQNLMFNDYDLPIDISSYSSVMVNYLQGCQNRLHLRPLPHFFHGKKFFDACYLIYFKSIKDFFTKVSTIDDVDVNRPVLLIGVVDKTKIKIYGKEEIMFLPSDITLNEHMQGIFISYDDEEYLNNVINSFTENKRGKTMIVKKEFEEIRNNREKMLYSEDDDQGKGKMEGIEISDNSNNSDNSDNSKHTNKDEGNGKTFKIASNKPRKSEILSELENMNKLTKLTKLTKKATLIRKGSLKEIIEDEDEKDSKTAILSEVKPKISFKSDVVVHSKQSEGLSEIKVPAQSSTFGFKNIITGARRGRPSLDFHLDMFSPQNYGSDATNLNMQMLNEVEEQDQNVFHSLLHKQANKRYGNMAEEDTQFTQDFDIFVESRIFELQKINIGEFISSHIVIIGFQDNMGKLVKLITNHFPGKEVCILTNNDSEKRQIHKLMRQHPSVIYLKGETENPFHLLNAGLNKAFACIFLSESVFSKTKEDMGKILSYRSIDYFFNTEIVLELWSHASTKFLGYQPLDRSLKTIKNEFMHPIYMAGRVIYLSHLDKLIANSYLDENKTDVWTNLLSLGYTPSSTSVGFKTLCGNKNSFPVILTIDVPTEYHNKEYHTLFHDMLFLDNPALCLGIYVENPLDYLSLQSQGKVMRLTRKQTEHLKITTSHKRKLVNLNILDKVEQSYKDNLKIIRDISFNDRVILDYVDINKSHLPIFITNPYPGFMLNERCKMMVLYHFKSPSKGHSSKKLKFNKFDSRKNFVQKNSISYIYDSVKGKLNKSQENFFYYYDALKEKAKQSFAESMKNVERQRAEKLEEILNLNKR